MFLSKIWFVLVGLAAGVALAAAFVAPRAADRRIVNLEGERLDRAQYAAEQMLKADAHSWIDYASKLSRDANLAESLDAASRSAGEPRLLHETVRARLRTLVPDTAAIGLQTVGAVDAKGRVIARLGDRDREHGESMAGIEVIADALRGYLSDDVWGAGGKLQRVAAVPVLSKARDRIVGALWVGAETGKRLAEIWKQNLRVEIAILLRGQVTASTIADPFLTDLAPKIEERRKQMLELKRTLPIPLAVGRDRLLVVAAPFLGQAGEQGGVFALIQEVPAAKDPLALFRDVKADDLRWGNFPWLGLATVLILILGVGLLLQRFETERPLHRLREEVQRLARGDLHKLDDTAHPGRFGGIARDVNAAMERFTLAPAPRSETARKDVGAILGPAPTPPPMQPASVFDLPQSHFDPLGSASSAVASFGNPNQGNQSPQGFMAPLPELPPPPPPREASPPRGYGGPPTLSSTAADLGATPERRLVSPQLGGNRPPPPALAAPPPPPSATSLEDSAATGISAPPLGLAAEAGDFQGAGAMPWGSRERMTTSVGNDPPASVFGGDRGAVTSVGAQSNDRDERESESQGGGPLTNGGGGEDAAEEQAYAAHIREVFEAYVATRQQCGETVATLTLDKFQARLETNRQQLMAKYNCRGARFSVYVKDGKAAVKAMPLR